MPFRQNVNNEECCVCMQHTDYLYQVPGNCADTAPGGGSPVCPNCFSQRMDVQSQNHVDAACICNRVLSDADFNQVIDDYVNPHDNGVAEGVNFAEVAPAFAGEAQQEEEQHLEEEEEEHEHEGGGDNQQIEAGQQGLAWHKVNSRPNYQKRQS